MNNQAQLEELLVKWGLQRQQGNELTAEELCADAPEIALELSQMISHLKEMDWLEEDEDSVEDFLPLPDFTTVSGHADETLLLQADLSIDDFCQRLADSELIDGEQIAKIWHRLDAKDARSFASRLVEGKKLTRFQATVLLEGRSTPLVLDRYVLLDELGAGGMGAVFKALHQQMDRVVALKILPKGAVDSPEKARRFHREVRAAAKLEHPNIVTAFDANEDKGYHYLVMSLVMGSDLFKVVREQGALAISKAVDYVTQAARGLEHAHSMGIVHRDIKPANLLLNRNGVVKILDMGLARMDSGDSGDQKQMATGLTQTGMVMGTIAYLAPEQALDTRNADARSDIYSLGCTLYFLLTGKKIYSEDTMMKTMLAHRESDIPLLQNERESVPDELQATFEKMVAKNPEDRFQSMAEVISALDTIEIVREQRSRTTSDRTQSYQETKNIGRLETSREITLTKPVSITQCTRKWGIITVCLLALMGVGCAWAGVIFLKVETDAGTIVLEIDQPELAGAEVTVDGQQRIRIKSGQGREPIEIVGDEKAHQLKVRKGGFQTFTKAFTVKAGQSQTIKVRLERVKNQVADAKLSSQPRSIAYVWPKGQPGPAIAPFPAEGAQKHQEAWAEHLGVPVEVENSIGIQLRVIPPGEFLMGSSEEEVATLMDEAREQNRKEWYIEAILDEAPKHHVTLTRPLMMAACEVTLGHFRRFVAATGYETDAERDGKGGFGYVNNMFSQSPDFLWNTDVGFLVKQTDEHPVVNVSWNDAVAFCDWLSEHEGEVYRLPTEAEWEFVCRAGSDGRYGFGDDDSRIGQYAWYDSIDGRWPKPVGQKRPNSFGIFDMHGNVAEWCRDGFCRYDANSSVNPLGLNKRVERVWRGGSFSLDSGFHRSACRLHASSVERSLIRGFRVVKEVQPSSLRD